MRPLGPRNRRRGRSRGPLESWLHLDLQVLAMQTQAGVPLLPSVPVSPEEGSRAYRQGMKQDAHLARFGRGPPVPLALVAQGTRTAVTNAGGIDDPQAAITLSTVLVRDQHVACRTSQGSIRLEGKVGSGEAASFPRRVAVGGGAYPEAGAEEASEAGLVGAYSFGALRAGANSVARTGKGGKLVPQLQSQVPAPLSHDLPGFLSPGRMATPSVRLLFLVFVFQSGFKGTAVQIEGYHIRGSEGALGKLGPEEFIHDSVANEPDLPFLFLRCRGWVGGHNDANEWSALVQALVWAVVERTADPTHLALFRCWSAGKCKRVWIAARPVSAVVFAAGHRRKIAQVGDDCSGPILAIQAHQRACSGKAVGRDVLLDGSFRPAEFLAILSIPRVAKAGHPLM